MEMPCVCVFVCVSVLVGGVFDMHSNTPGSAVVIGEWGGHNVDLDAVWQEALADFLVDQGFEDTFYWCLVRMMCVCVCACVCV